MKEIWKPVKGFEGIYEVSNIGTVRSIDRYMVHNTYKESAKPKRQLHRGKIIKQYINNQGKGYMYVILWLHSKSYKRYVHRLVAESFIENPNGFPEVNHIDGNPKNNSVSNLEWTTHAENIKHSIITGLTRGKERNVVGTNIKTNEKIYFDSIQKAAKHFGVYHTAICIALKGYIEYKEGKRETPRTSCGYIWEYR